MGVFLLDTNHLGAALHAYSPLRESIFQKSRDGNRFGTCVPVLCEMEAGYRPLALREAHERALRRLMQHVRIWPLEPEVATTYGKLYQELRAAGRVLSQVDLMLAALARQKNLTLLTSDRDFDAVSGLRLENWLVTS